MSLKDLFNNDIFIIITLGLYFSYIGYEFFEKLFELLHHYFLH